MPSPVRFEQYGKPHADIMAWLGVYAASTSGDNVSLRLDIDNEPQPDALLRLDRKLGGNTGIIADGYLEGTPELIIEVAASSSNFDMRDKKKVYARNGVREYLVLLSYEKQVKWFFLEETATGC